MASLLISNELILIESQRCVPSPMIAPLATMSIATSPDGPLPTSTNWNFMFLFFIINQVIPFFLADLWTHSMTFMNCSICSFGVKTWNILLFWLRKLCLSLAASWLRISHEECYYLSICNCVFLSVCIFVLANSVWVCWPAGRVLPTPAGRVSPAFQRFSHFLYREEP